MIDDLIFFFFFGQVACGNQFPGQVLNSPLLHQKHRVLTTGLPGQSKSMIFGVTIVIALGLPWAIPNEVVNLIEKCRVCSDHSTDHLFYSSPYSWVSLFSEIQQYQN